MFWNKKPVVKETKEYNGIFSTDMKITKLPYDQALARSIQFTMDNFVAKDATGALVTGMDGDTLQQQKALFGGIATNIPGTQLEWYANQGFIGFQMCGILAQNWLIDKACTLPARDAVRHGYTITVNDGTEVEEEVLDKLRTLDKQFKIKKHMIEFIRMGRIFGIRVAMFNVDGIDYEKPFNLDGVRVGAYKGITQIDPYWITPELDIESASNPASMYFYEPTWWRVNGKRVHRTHLCIYRPSEVVDILKPSYIFAGVSIPQKIAERVFSAEITANEAPKLVMSKRMTTFKMDMSQGIANQADLTNKIQEWCDLMNNFGVKVHGEDEEIKQFETSLTGIDETIMTQFQLVSSAGDVPMSKLMNTMLKGFNKGEYDEANYHEGLESIQENDLTQLVDRHHQLVIRSELPKHFPEFTKKPFEVTLAWNPLDAMTAAELADVNSKKAETGLKLQQAGAIDGEDERQRLITDPDSGYSGMAERVIEDPDAESYEPMAARKEAEGSTNIPVRPSTPVQGANPDDEEGGKKAPATKVKVDPNAQNSY